MAIFEKVYEALLTFFKGLWNALQKLAEEITGTTFVVEYDK